VKLLEYYYHNYGGSHFTAVKTLRQTLHIKTHNYLPRKCKNLKPNTFSNWARG